MKNQFYVYKHYRKHKKNRLIDGPFYIGKGSKNRAFCKSKRNSYWKNIVEKDGIRVEIVCENMEESEAYILEKVLVRAYQSRGFCEANLQDGGANGGSYSKSSRDKISKALKAHYKENSVWNKGKTGVYSEESLDKIRKARAKQVFTKEHIKKRAKKLKGKKRPVEVIEKMVSTKLSRAKSFIVTDKNGKTVWTGKSQKQCCIDLNLQRSKVSLCLSGKRKTTGGFRFEYV